MPSTTPSSWKPWTRRVAWLVVIASLPVFLLDWPVHHDPEYRPHFACERWWGFFAGLSFLGCLLLVCLAKIWQRLIRRPEEYYGE